MGCGGIRDLGGIGSGVSGAHASGGTSGTSGAAKDCTAPNACGPALGMPATVCSDGSTGGNTGKCIAQKDGTCGWEIRECPSDPPTVCFGKDGALDPSYKKCATSADCVAVDYQLNCCGSMHAAGTSKTSQAAVTACAAERAKGFPLCGCPTMPTVSDDTSTDTGVSGTKAVFCNAAGLCETSFKGKVCGTTVCGPSQTCCSGVPLPEPTCYNENICPISQREHKKDIAYLGEVDRQRLSEELLGIPLATYRYTSESKEERAHLGFIIDDIAPSPAVVASGERVDMYGYATMSVATLQIQAREIAALRRELEALQREVANGRAKK